MIHINKVSRGRAHAQELYDGAAQAGYVQNRIIAIFLISSLIPFICLGFISFYTINSILGNKVEAALQNNLNQELTVLENTLKNMNYVSQQLAFGEGTNKLLEELFHETESYQQIQLRNNIKAELNILSYSNLNFGPIIQHSDA